MICFGPSECVCVSDFAWVECGLLAFRGSKNESDDKKSKEQCKWKEFEFALSSLNPIRCLYIVCVILVETMP